MDQKGQFTTERALKDLEEAEEPSTTRAWQARLQGLHRPKHQKRSPHGPHRLSFPFSAGYLHKGTVPLYCRALGSSWENEAL